MFVAAFNVDRNGWCVFRLIDDLTMTYHAGPFSERAGAESEARRLNDMTPNAKVQAAGASATVAPATEGST